MQLPAGGVLLVRVVFPGDRSSVMARLGSLSRHVSYLGRCRPLAAAPDSCPRVVLFLRIHLLCDARVKFAFAFLFLRLFEFASLPI